MTIYDPMKAVQDDARPAGQQDRLLREARRARRARRQRLVPAAGALLLGRRGYEWLAARWPSRRGELADRLPKYVVSATLEHPAWNNSAVLKGDVLNEVSALKQHIDGDIVIAGSFQLVRTLIEHDLVDELRLKIFPVALGVGERLLGETSDKKPMRLLDTQTLEGGIAYLTYQSVRDA
jgi:dihydrofolate reductase